MQTSEEKGTSGEPEPRPWMLTFQLLRIPVCKALDGGVMALFGPRSGTTSAHVQSICDSLEIPHVETRWA